MTNKIITLILFLFLFSINSIQINAQNVEMPLQVYDPEKDVKNKDNFICILTIEPIPEFIGGSKEMFEFLRTNICYPDSARVKGIDGTIYVGFTVEIDGTLTNIRIKRGKNELNEESLRVVRLMSGKWKAGIQNGKPISTNFTLPIKFHLE
jgi:periplasmic protein TonB